MKPKDMITWAASVTAVLLTGCIGLCGMHEMFRRTFPDEVLTPSASRALLILAVASLVSTFVVRLSKVTTGTFQFSGLGITFKGLACQATLWVLVFISFSAAFLAMMKFVS